MRVGLYDFDDQKAANAEIEKTPCSFSTRWTITKTIAEMKMQPDSECFLSIWFGSDHRLEKNEFLRNNQTHQIFPRGYGRVFQGPHDIENAASNNTQCRRYEGLNVENPPLARPPPHVQKPNGFPFVLSPDFQEARYFVKAHIWE